MKNILFFACMLYSSISFSQTTEPEKQVKEFFKQLNALPKNQDPDLITNLLTDDFTTLGYNSLISLSYFKDDLNRKMENSVLYPNETTFHKIEKNIKLISSENFTVSICEVQLKYNGGLSFNYIYTFILKKIENTWKIEYIGISELIDAAE